MLTKYTHYSDHVHDSVLLDYCDAGQLWDPVLSAYFYHMNPTSFELTRLFPPGPTTSRDSNLTSFLYFDGIWGDAQYAGDDPRQRTVPVFGLKRYVSGPQGPIFKGLVRKGLFPDNPEPKKFIQLAVGFLMSWYPCCLRGWRLVVSLTVVVACIMLTVVGIRYCVRRYRMRKGYKRIDAEIPLEDMSLSEDVMSDYGEDSRK